MKETDSTTSFHRADDWRRFVEYLRHTNRFALTDSWRSFMNRLIDTATKRVATIALGSEFFRARQGIAWVEEEFGGERPAPYSKQEMGPPPARLAQGGRLNPGGIPYLYLASDIKTAIAEVRPWIGLELSVGRFETTEIELVPGEEELYVERDPASYSDEEKGLAYLGRHQFRVF
ncbi:MAG: hypothetical protein QOI77_3737 [Blastocatellia bacterium]|nr:hypothetical protein [Blastocatellia bacterium]